MSRGFSELDGAIDTLANERGRHSALIRHIDASIPPEETTCHALLMTCHALPWDILHIRGHNFTLTRDKFTVRRDKLR